MSGAQFVALGAGGLERDGGGGPKAHFPHPARDRIAEYP